MCIHARKQRRNPSSLPPPCQACRLSSARRLRSLLASPSVLAPIALPNGAFVHYSPHVWSVCVRVHARCARVLTVVDRLRLTADPPRWLLVVCGSNTRADRHCKGLLKVQSCHSNGQTRLLRSCEPGAWVAAHCGYSTGTSGALYDFVVPLRR